MKLYRMELYKLCHRKIVIISAFFMFVIQMLFCAMKVSEEWTCVDGVLYNGYEAIEKNRQITEEFQGVLTDEKVNAIVEKYGFPQEVVQNYGNYRDGNYLNVFVAEHLSDGFFHGWNEGEYRIATRTYPIADTELGAARELTGQEIVLEYTNGCSVFVDMLNGGTVLSSILILFMASVLFAGERQTKMIPLLFTSKEGRKKDIYMKIAAVFTVTVCIWSVMVLSCFILCGAIYGFDGLDSLVGMTKITLGLLAKSWSVSIWTVRHFLAVVMFRSFISVIMLCATTIYISARCRSSFHAVYIALMFWGLPLLLWFILPDFGIKILIYATPLYQGMCDTIFDISGIWPMLAQIGVAWSFFCVVIAGFKYKKQQTE